jgi:hypothetical protein
MNTFLLNPNYEPKFSKNEIIEVNESTIKITDIFIQVDKVMVKIFLYINLVIIM